MNTPEHLRLAENPSDKMKWYRWGPYLSERQWGTVREDYSANGGAWDSFPHDHARSRAYRWGEDGIGGLSDRHGLINFSVGMWNHADPILKERLFGLTNGEGNHGEDVKEIYFYEDALPSHAYLKMRYRYPVQEFPYTDLVNENNRRGFNDREYEILDTTAFNNNQFFDVVIEYAKATSEDILWKITVTNHDSQQRPFTLLPQVILRNRWSWDNSEKLCGLSLDCDEFGQEAVSITTERYGKRWIYATGDNLSLEWLFTENETNFERLYGTQNPQPYVKDGFHERIVNGNTGAVNPDRYGTKVGLVAHTLIEGGETMSVCLRFSNEAIRYPFAQFDEILSEKIAEADAFYESAVQADTDEEKRVQRQALAGLIWTKQFYHFDVDRWRQGDPAMSAPPMGHGRRNSSWDHLHVGEILSMPDKWEYPWFAAWDTAFHMIPLTLIDGRFAKDQLLLLMREWYMHPNGQIPAYEWNYGDVNPPVHAWSIHRVFRIDWRVNGKPDYEFLEKAFHKLLINFTWWINRKDEGGNNVFEGGFLGLDNIGLFDRNVELGNGTYLEQSDGTSWMAMYCLNMLGIATELTRIDPTYEDIASKFFEHFVYIADAMHRSGLWNEEDQFYYDVLCSSHGSRIPIKVRSLVGLIPLYAVTVLEAEDYDRMPNFRRRLNWFVKNRPHLVTQFFSDQSSGQEGRYVLSLVNPDRLRSLLSRMLDPEEFLSPHGIRGLSRYYNANPYAMNIEGTQHEICYVSGDSKTGMFGGNSNWRGPVWFPVNYLLIESLQKYHYFLGDDFKVECPVGSGHTMSLWEVSLVLSKRLTSLFLPDANGKRPIHEDPRYQGDPLWNDKILFFEFFDGDTGRGLGAAHQTGWTALVAKLIDQVSHYQ